MRNPYEDERDLTEYRISRRAAAGVCAVFLLLLALPPLADLGWRAVGGGWEEGAVARLLAYRPGSGVSLREHLAGVESGLDRLPYARDLRRGTQQFFTSALGEGSGKVLIGPGGWLFYRPEIQAITGWGPLKIEPFSVMKDPEVARLRPAREHVLAFAAALQERGIPLLLVPVPVKTMLYPELLLRQPPEGALTHPDQDALFASLREAGIDVLDVSGDLLKRKKWQRPFLRQDTHWTPEAMKRAATLVADHVRKHYPEAAGELDSASIDARILERSSLGDLVDLLDLADPGQLFKPEPAQLVSLRGVDPDPASPVTLLGDSFVNVFSDPRLGFGTAEEEEKGESLRAGFAYQLGLYLGRPLDVIAVNGAGTTATRREFAARPDDVVRSKKLVIWVLAARDLLYSPAAAREANVDWAAVAFNPNQSKQADPKPTAATGGAVVVEAELVEKSANDDPNVTPYKDALHTALYRVTRVVSGSFDPAMEWQAVQWTFRRGEMQPPSRFVPGRRYRLTLEPLEQREDVQGLNIRNDSTTLDEFTTDRWFVAEAEELR
jgi:hypothetical protein